MKPIYYPSATPTPKLKYRPKNKKLMNRTDKSLGNNESALSGTYLG